MLRGAVEKKEKLIRSLPTDLDVNIRRQELQFMPGQRRDTTWISRMEVCMRVYMCVFHVQVFYFHDVAISLIGLSSRKYEVCKQSDMPISVTSKINV